MNNQQTYSPFADTKTKADLKFLLEMRHKGRPNAAKGIQLIEELWGADAARDRSYNNPHHRSLRTMIEELNREEGSLICSDSTKGYWWAADLQDGMVAAEQNLNRAKKMEKNAETLIGNLMKTYGRLF